MKVVEKNTDRTAEVNVFVEGQVPALKEYGEYIDSRDKAICCYVALYEGDKPRIRGQFSGTTLAVAWDTIVDGVLRKANSYAARAVSFQNKRKMDTVKFLYKTTKGIIDTDITVVPLPGFATTQNNDPETIGTLELRVYITRQLGTWHDIGEVKKYFTVGGSIGDKQTGSMEQKASYKDIPPTFGMSFETNAALLEDRQPSLQQRKVDAKRPGTEPWAIFRFHYRSQEDILKREMKMTHDPNSKEKPKPHTLFLNPVPPLLLGEKSCKNDGDASSRSSSLSPMPPSKPSTPARSAKPGLKVTVKKALDSLEIDRDTPNISAGSGDDKLVDKVAVTPAELITNCIAKLSNLPGLETSPALLHPEIPAVAAEETLGKSPPSPITQGKKPVERPGPICGITSMRKKPDTPLVAAIPTKRQISTTNSATSEPKRTKAVLTPPAPFIEPIVPSTPRRSPTPKPISIERQLADQRKKLEELRKKRSDTAHKQAVIDKEMIPYKQRMVEELDRLHQMMTEEEKAYAEETEHYSASIGILQAFKKTEGSN
ncbi:hypothetical protein GT037_007736 [Alternaria burnsii]|uniref:Uncharacterized protein n=1 Tax=Alternaria burnsii TaxID=1187904 RepID=A0A8H7AYM2_9PLEO|nr:uncharacterized protein GT037_007736 [Alternaria burnsii]KAF7673970.1 hypothetical protein GT037_007736 [Alternaria burnsii]CAI9635291.1 unnamed protein product [Alternaria burnsii]